MSRRFWALLFCALALGGSAIGMARDSAAKAAVLPVGRPFLPLLQADDSAPTVDGFVRGVSTAMRQNFRRAIATIKTAMKSWTRYAKRGARWIVLAFVVSLLDRNMLAAWRATGLRVLTTYIPLMLYVNIRLFFDRRVFWLGKILLVSAIAYGIWRHDFIPDRSPLPGYIEDVVLVVLATRLLLTWSGDEVVFEHANTAVQRLGRLVSLQRARR